MSNNILYVPVGNGLEIVTYNNEIFWVTLTSYAYMSGLSSKKLAKRCADIPTVEFSREELGKFDELYDSTILEVVLEIPYKSGIKSTNPPETMYKRVTLVPSLIFAKWITKDMMNTTTANSIYNYGAVAYLKKLMTPSVV